MVDERTWVWSDVAMLAVCGAIVGAALASRSSESQSGVEAVADPDIESTTTAVLVASLAVEGRNVPTTEMTARAPRSGSVQMFSEGDIGVLPPLGVYDPLGLIETRDMRRYEIMEIKHGR